MGQTELLAAAKRVIANWERGDLAHAVNQLDAAIKLTEMEIQNNRDKDFCPKCGSRDTQK